MPASCEPLFLGGLLSAWEGIAGTCLVPHPRSGTVASLLQSEALEAVQKVMDGHAETVMKEGVAAI